MTGPDGRPAPTVGRHAGSAVGLLALGTAVAAYAWNRSRSDAYSLRGRTVLVTGGSRGLGFELASEFARRGARLAIVARSRGDLDFAAQRLREAGADVLPMVTDVRDPTQVSQAVTRAVEWSGRLDVLVNNAGIITVAPLAETPVDDYEQSIRTHFWGPYHCVQAALPHLRREGGGRILNIASIGGRVGVPHLSAYSAGKFALVGWSETLRAGLAQEGIRVTTATPGLMRTGSHVRAVVRGRHRAEARWFAAGMVTPLTSMDARRAARQIVDACVAGRAHVTPGIQARALEVAQGLAPGVVAMAASLAARLLLPAPSSDGEGHVARRAGDVGFGWLGPLLPEDPADAVRRRA